MPHFKSGVVMWNMHPAITDGMSTIDSVSIASIGREAIITTARDGEHSRTSLHYRGRALDLRTRDLTESQKTLYRDSLAEALGDDWDVVLETTHIHVEFDPK